MERFERFTVLITNIARCIRKIKTEEMTRWNLRSHHVPCIYYLYTKGALTAKKLCDICKEDKANISRSIDYLEEEGFVIQKSNTKKRYNAQYVLTEKGQFVGKTLSDRVNEIINMASSDVSEEERDIMYKCLEAVYDRLNTISDEYKK
jgi:DNA-binding MarR family transcriptional regulator